ncbi:MAG TPA: allophanate hydrolase [Polyangia bacterium]|jgi:allophanate hydrolase
MASDHDDALLDGGIDLGTLSRRYAAGETSPSAVVKAVLARLRRRGDDAVWISIASEDALLSAARAVEARRAAGERLPLYGVPFGVKDNIDVAGFATTAACPAFSYEPQVSAVVVERLVAAGAIVIGKTNLDQFATGLVGVRSPYGIPRNAFNGDHVSGGSSSGSALAVALGEVSFALGTDTAGSGRVPAAFNNVVGLKPSPGVISTAGVVPACRSLDCVSVFAATCEDAAAVAELARGFNAADPCSRPGADSVRFAPFAASGPFRFGVPRPADREFLGDAAAAASFERDIEQLVAAGGTSVEIDLAPFLEAGLLLYEGPYVAQRLAAAGRLLAEQPGALLPPIRTILEGATRHRADAAYEAEAKLTLLRRRVATVWPRIEFLLLPTAPTIPRIEAVQNDPIRLNGALGRYTTFVNLLDLAAIAIPTGMRDDQLPAGVTLMGPWGSDARLASHATRLHRATSSRIGATALALPPSPSTSTAAPSSSIPLAVVGAHLSGEPLNHQLTSLGGTLLRTCRTAPHYRLFALPGTVPPKPGLVRVTDGGGVAVEVEVWELTPAAFGAFVAAIPAPLAVGKLSLEDGVSVSGFLAEAHATLGAEDISSFGGWRAFRRSRA